MIFVLRIPLVESVLIVMVIVVFTLIVVISVLVVALSVSFSVALSHCGVRRQQEYSEHAGGHPFHRSHGYSPPKVGSSSLASREALACLGWEDLSGLPLGPWYSDNLPFVVTSSREIFGEQVWWRAGSVTGQAERRSLQRQRVKMAA
jgi:hypothetical protein